MQDKTKSRGELLRSRNRRLKRTASALLIPAQDLYEGVYRHAHGDWGAIDAAAREANEKALLNGGRLCSSYNTKGGIVYQVITEADSGDTIVRLGMDE